MVPRRWKRWPAEYDDDDGGGGDRVAVVRSRRRTGSVGEKDSPDRPPANRYGSLIAGNADPSSNDLDFHHHHHRRGAGGGSGGSLPWPWDYDDHDCETAKLLGK